MILPSIDLQNGHAVQLIGGKELDLDAGDPRPIAQRFARCGEIAVVDLDRALGRGDNDAVVEDLLAIAPVRLGGGIRSAHRALHWLDRGVTKVVLGTAATPEVLSELPRERVVAALDAQDGEVVDHGWTRGTGHSILERIEALRDYVSGFLVTFVEREGRLGGTDLERARSIVEAADGLEITIAGGVTTADEVQQLDEIGCNAQVGMALYRGHMDLAEAFTSPMRSDREDGLWPTIVTDELGTALGLVYSNLESVRAALAEACGIYWSRKRGLWRKGETSGDGQELLRFEVDCDRDSLKAVVRQKGEGFCHLARRSCFGVDSGLGALDRTLEARRLDAPDGSYTKRLFDDADLLGRKILEEARELVDARNPDQIRNEAADLMYFALTKARANGVDLEQIASELDRRSLRVRRRSQTAGEKSAEES